MKKEMATLREIEYRGWQIAVKAVYRGSTFKEYCVNGHQFSNLSLAFDYIDDAKGTRRENNETHH